MLEFALGPALSCDLYPPYMDGDLADIGENVRDESMRFRNEFRSWMGLRRFKPPIFKGTVHRTGIDCSFSCQTLAAKIQDYYNCGTNNVLQNPALKNLDDKDTRNVCDACLEAYARMEQSVAVELWALLPKWAGRKEWSDFEKRT